MAPVSLPVFVCGLATCIPVEKFQRFRLRVRSCLSQFRKELHKFDEQNRTQRNAPETLRLIAQGSSVSGLSSRWLSILPKSG